MTSIRRYLLVSLLGVAAAGMLATGLASWLDAAHEVEELFDAQLAQSARMLLATGALPAAVAGPVEVVTVPAQGAPGHKYESRLLLQWWSADGRLLMRSANAPVTALAPLVPGFHRPVLDGGQYHLFVVASDGNWLLVGQDDYMRRELAGEIALAAFLPHLVGIPLLALLIGWLVGRGLAPLASLRRALAGRGAGNLAPVQLPREVEELQPVVRELNGLLARLEASLARERRLADDAAHELRTPLAVLRLHAENAVSATTDGERRQALASLVRGVDRATRVVGQLLTLARLEPGDDAALRAPVPLNTLVREELAELAPMARRRGQELDFHADREFAVEGVATTLGILVRNLVDNALRYSPEGGLVRVLLRDAAPGTVELAVLDEGPGVPPEQAARVFERFYRGDPGRGDGAGLGLAIVQRIVDAHGGHVVVRPRRGEAPGGFVVTLPEAGARA